MTELHAAPARSLLIGVALSMALTASPAFADTTTEEKRAPSLPALQLDAFPLVDTNRALSFHKPIYLLPLTYSPQYEGDRTEVLYQFSLKQRLFNRNLFFAYTQKSFWQLYDGGNSRPFRETNYNPELFYRYVPNWNAAPGLGFDIGIDHESNGKDLPESRSWNRIVAAAFHVSGHQLWHLRAWYRLPEKQGLSPDDPQRDDNPHIERYFGYAELRWQRKLFGTSNHRLAMMLRGNPASGKGAIQAVYSAPLNDELFWSLWLWNGYGESLSDYDRSVARIGLGIMLAR